MRRASMADELGDLLLQYGAVVRQFAATFLLSTRGEAEAARRKYDRMVKRHVAARTRFLKRWGNQ